RNRQIIGLTFFLALCLFGGGLYHSFSVDDFPCDLGSLDESRNFARYLNFLSNRRLLASNIKKHAEAAGIDLAKSQGVCVSFDKERGVWMCSIASSNDAFGCNRWQLDIDQDGKLLWLADRVKNEEELKRILAEEKELQELLRDYCDYLVRPQIY